MNQLIHLPGLKLAMITLRVGMIVEPVLCPGFRSFGMPSLENMKRNRCVGQDAKKQGPRAPERQATSLRRSQFCYAQEKRYALICMKLGGMGPDPSSKDPVFSDPRKRQNRWHEMGQRIREAKFL